MKFINCACNVKFWSSVKNIPKLSALFVGATLAISQPASGATINATAEIRSANVSTTGDLSTLPPGEDPVGGVRVTKTGFDLPAIANVGVGLDESSQSGVLSFVNEANYDFTIGVIFDFTSSGFITFATLDEEPRAELLARALLTRDGAIVGGTIQTLKSIDLPFPRLVFQEFRIDSFSREFRFVLGPGDQTVFQGEMFASAFAPPIPIPAAAWTFLTALGGLGLFGWRKRRCATLQSVD